MSNEIKVTFQPSGRSVYVLPGTLLLEAAGRAGIILQTPCGGKGTCGKCKVRLVGGHPAATEATGNLSEALVKEGYRLACQAHVAENLVVEIPRESMFEATEQILTGDTGQVTPLRPVVRKQFFDLGAPSVHDAGSDASRLQATVGDVAISFSVLQKLPGFLRANDWQGTAVVIGDRLAGLEVGDTRRLRYGVAMDLGTTTIVGTLFDLTTGQELAACIHDEPAGRLWRRCHCAHRAGSREPRSACRASAGCAQSNQRVDSVADGESGGPCQADLRDRGSRKLNHAAALVRPGSIGAGGSAVRAGV